jgi:malonyl-CoA/methylmalonyl-CoA synthetase
MTNGLYQMLLGRHDESKAPLLHLPDGKTVSYAQMAQNVAQISGMLRASGLCKGERLAMQGPKSSQSLALYLACIHSGVIFLPLNTAYTPDEVRYFVEDAAPKIIVTDPKAEAALRPVAQSAGAVLLTLDAHEQGTFADAVAGAVPNAEAVPCGRDDLACFLYTSGNAHAGKPDVECQNADVDLAVHQR